MAFAGLELRERAVRFLTQHGAASEEVLLRDVFAGPTPVAVRQQLVAPLLADPRLQRSADGVWSIRSVPHSLDPKREFTALALVATGPTPGRGHLARVVGLRVARGEVVERFDATLNPGRHVPGYVSERIGVESAMLNDLPMFADVLDELQRFIDDRPVLAQDARLTWAFVQAEAQQLERVLPEPPLFDVNDIASRVLDLKKKPTLGLIAAQLGVSSVRIVRVDDEARVLALVGPRLLDDAQLTGREGSADRAVLRRGSTARSLPDEPGVYVMRDRDQTPLYVGKARRLRGRMAAYVHRPLGTTRRFEGLVGAVQQVDSTSCETDLEALILEEREIRRLQPRFNTVRRQRTPRYWIRLAAWRPKLAPPRLELSAGPAEADGEFVGPFRNEAMAEQARGLARDVFDLDRLRREDPHLYRERLGQAWEFLHGDGLQMAADLAGKQSTSLLRRVVAFDLRSGMLPADPRHARYAVIRAGSSSVEGFLLDHAVLRRWTTLQHDSDVHAFAQRLLAFDVEPRTTPEDVDVVLRWFGAQRPASARLVFVGDGDPLAASDVIEAAALELLAAARETAPAGLEDARDAIVDP